jgi:hypothetical protein
VEEIAIASLVAFEGSGSQLRQHVSKLAVVEHGVEEVVLVTGGDGLVHLLKFPILTNGIGQASVLRITIALQIVLVQHSKTSTDTNIFGVELFGLAICFDSRLAVKAVADKDADIVVLERRGKLREGSAGMRIQCGREASFLLSLFSKPHPQKRRRHLHIVHGV